MTCQILQFSYYCFLRHEGRVFLVCERFLELSSFFTFPLNSADIDIFKVKRLSGHLYVVQSSSIKRKFVLLSHIDCHVAIPLVQCIVNSSYVDGEEHSLCLATLQRNIVGFPMYFIVGRNFSPLFLLCRCGLPLTNS